MPAAGRVACIATPFLLSTLGLVCLIFIFLGGSFDRNPTVGQLYFAKIDLKNFTSKASANLAGQNAKNLTNLGGALQAAKQQLNMYDYYTVYLRGYCGWNGNDLYANCSSPATIFSFNPIQVWGLKGVESSLPKDLKTGLDTYMKVSKAMGVSFLVAVLTTAATLLVGISAMFSRWGSFATTFVATASWIFTLAGAAMATALFATLKVSLNNELEKQYGVKTTLGQQGYIVAWVAAAATVGAGFFWLLSVCCCSGKTYNAYGYKPGSSENRRTRAEKTPYTYERVGSPTFGPDGGSMPMGKMGASAPRAEKNTAYEPFRHQ